jgi:hypothetical protein
MVSRHQGTDRTLRVQQSECPEFLGHTDQRSFSTKPWGSPSSRCPW